MAEMKVEKKYSNVIVIGVDGAGAFIEKADTPNFNRIFSDAAVTYSALSSFPTISAECWGSMFIGVGPKVHKLTNRRVSILPYPKHSKHPTVFRRIRTAYPDAEIGSFCNWNPINKGIVERNLNVTEDTGSDKELTPKICEYIKEKKPLFLFVHFDGADGAGHKNGYGTKAHLESIHEIDKYVDDIYTAAEDAGIADDTLFMLIADHGGTNPGDGKGGSHGGWTDAEKYVTFAAKGKGIKSGPLGYMNIRDLAAIIVYALGIELPAFHEKHWTSQIPEGLFEGGDIPAYRDISHLTRAKPRISDEQHKSRLN
ncbi:MAG: alkaline phosphatase [Clostridiales bacterium]|nr:alkaline phosphatase [Clostridiales bacterium]